MASAVLPTPAVPAIAEITTVPSAPLAACSASPASMPSSPDRPAKRATAAGNCRGNALAASGSPPGADDDGAVRPSGGTESRSAGAARAGSRARIC